MKCLILAAGLGSRLRAVSPSKPLTLLGRTPLIEHVILRAAAAGVREFMVVTGHEAERVEAFLVTLPPRLGVSVEWTRVADWTRPNGYSVTAGAAMIDGDYLLLMSDHLFDPEISRRLLHAGVGAGLKLAVDTHLANPLVDLDDATKVEVGAAGEIIRIGKTLTRYNAVDTGIFLATPELAGAIRLDIEKGGGGSLSEGVQRLAEGGRALTMEVEGRPWIDIDDPRALALAESRPEFAATALRAREA